MTYLLIAIGSALGGMARYWCSGAIAARVESALPWGTIAVNVLGSMLIGIALGILEPNSRIAVAPVWRDYINQFFMIGVLGGYTTFSSFSLQTLVLIREQQWIVATANVVVSVVLCLLAVAIGFWVATVATQLRN